MRIRIHTLMSAALLLACVAFGEDGVDQLIHQLGASNYAKREAASAALARMGAEALTALERAAQSEDPEISLRAKALLRDIREGISPSWPEALRQEVRAYPTLDIDHKKALAEKLVSEQGIGAIPFLLRRVVENDDLASRCVALLKGMEPKQAVSRAVFGHVDDLTSPHGADLLVTACEWTEDLKAMAPVMKTEGLPDRERQRIESLAVKLLQESLDEGAAPAGIAEQAKAFSELAPREARLFYLQAAALLMQTRKDEADTVAAKALGLCPDSESKHFSAGDMLFDMGLLRYSEREWQLILRIPPADEVYDLNAYMRLGSIYARCGLYGRAADMLATGKEKYTAAKEKHGSSMGMIGGDQLDDKIRSFMARANEADEKALKVFNTIPVEAFKISLDARVKDGHGEELEAELAKVAMSMTSNVEPHGFRLFEKAAAGLQYDAEGGRINILLNNQPCAGAKAFVCRDATARIALHSLDMSYIYLLHRDTGNADKLKTFEWDYRLLLEPGPALRGWTHTTFELNGKTHTLEALKEGVEYDFLPKELLIEVNGTRPDGTPAEVRQQFDPVTAMKSNGVPREPTVIRSRIQMPVTD